MLVPALARLALTQAGYGVSVGTLRPRKNLIISFAVYAGLPTALYKRYRLAEALIKGRHMEGLMKSAEELNRRGEQRLLAIWQTS